MTMNAGTILDSIARTLWVDHWVTELEERGELPSQVNYHDVAPETPAEAYIDAARLVGHVEGANSLELNACWAKALRLDGTDWDALDAEETEKSKREFGYCIAMAGTGSGVSWMDDHEDYDLEVPEICCHYMPCIDEV